MTNQTIAFRINNETYLRLAVIAGDRGLSIGRYLKKRLEEEDENLLNDIRLMQTDLKDILNILENQNKQNVSKKHSAEVHNTTGDNLENNNIILEVLMILREMAQPSKLANAQAKVTSTGLKLYKLSENQI